MKNPIRKACNIAGVLGLALTLATNLTANAGNADKGAPRIAPPHSMAFGKSLAQWMGIYWRWYYSGADLANSVVDGVQLMPLPAGVQIGGSWTPEDPALLRGTLEITLRAGTPFVLPEFAWVGERYQGWPTVPDDPPMANEVSLASGSPTLTIDGKLVMSDANKAAFYVPLTYFDPIVVYPTPSSYGSVAALSFQGVAFVSPPLPVGVHVIHLYEPLIFPAGAYPGLPAGQGIIYDNTWVITVVPH